MSELLTMKLFSNRYFTAEDYHRVQRNCIIDFDTALESCCERGLAPEYLQCDMTGGNILGRIAQTFIKDHYWNSQNVFIEFFDVHSSISGDSTVEYYIIRTDDFKGQAEKSELCNSLSQIIYKVAREAFAQLCSKEYPSLNVSRLDVLFLDYEHYSRKDIACAFRKASDDLIACGGQIVRLDGDWHIKGLL